MDGVESFPASHHSSSAPKVALRKRCFPILYRGLLALPSLD